MEKSFEQIIIEVKSEILHSVNLVDLDNLRIKYLSKKGIISSLMSKMKDLSSDERPKYGQKVNILKEEINSLIKDKQKQIEQENFLNKINSERIDVSLTKNNYLKSKSGTKHILSQIIEGIEELFLGLGFKVYDGPEIENELYNFDKLNMPKNHPARDMQDTFYITKKNLLRTHTSPSQVRVMLNSSNNEPIKIICPGKTYRRDDDDATHSHQFMQIEGLYVDKKVSLGHLKGTLEYFLHEFFGYDRKVRFRSSFFPFTKPTVEVDISCANCSNKGCSICKGSGWIEILGAGLVHPNVLKACGYDPKKVQGFAFGIGVERIAMLKYNIDDIRNFYTNDTRFLNQFK